MAAQADVQPIIIKRKKKGGGDGHHGGAWKVAYADFVTAMMAFFMLMWLLNATTEKQRKGLADYFTPTVSIHRTSGGGDGAFGGDSVFSEQSLIRSGTGASSEQPTEEDAARGNDGDEAVEETFVEVEQELRGKAGESEVADEALKHIVSKVTDEGTVIEIFALPDAPLFIPDTDEPTAILRQAAILVSNAIQDQTNQIAIGGHVAAEPVVRRVVDVWDLSARQASVLRQLLEGAAIPPDRISRVTGHADREIVESNPLDIRNNRIEVILLRQ